MCMSDNMCMPLSHGAQGAIWARVLRLGRQLHINRQEYSKKKDCVLVNRAALWSALCLHGGSGNLGPGHRPGRTEIFKFVKVIRKKQKITLWQEACPC